MTAGRINLARYCADSFDPRPYLRVPFTRGGWVYACNGHVAVRVDRSLWDAVPDLPSDKLPTLEGMFAAAASRTDWMSLVNIPAPDRCGRCGGKGELRGHECESCKGLGEFEHYDHEYECKSCDGRGLFLDPDGKFRVTCTMRGCVRGAQSSGFVIGNNRADLVYLHWMSELPGVTVSAGNPGDRLHFRFSGGEAIVMPRRW